MKLQNGFKTKNSHFSPEIMPALFFRPCEIWPHPASDRTLYTHGGSWMFGSPDTDSYAQLGSRLAKVNGSSWRYLGYLHDIPSLWYLHDLIYRDKKNRDDMTFIIFRYEWNPAKLKDHTSRGDFQRIGADALEFQLKIEHWLIHSWYLYWYHVTWCANHFLSQAANTATYK